MGMDFGETKRVGLANSDQARYWAQRYLTTEAQPLVKIQFSVPWLGFFLLPGDKVKVSHRRFNLNSVLEILEAHYNFNSPPSVRLVCGNNRGWGDTFGFWSGPEGATTPPELGLVTWLRPENHIYAIDEELVHIWRDASPRADHAVQPFYDDAPLYRTSSSIYAANNLPSVQFSNFWNGQDYISDTLYFDSLSEQLTDNQAGEMFLVFKLDSLTPTTQGIGDISNCIYTFGSDTHKPTRIPHSAGDIRESFGCANYASGISAAGLVAGWNLWNVHRQAGNLTCRLNNVEVYNSDPGGAVAFHVSPSLGAANNLHYMNGAIAECIIYKRILSASERATVTQYLSSRYGLNLVAAPTAIQWNPNWNDDEVAFYRQNYGFVSGPGGMAHSADRRSHWAGRVW